MSCHRIRLRGPWSLSIHDQETNSEQRVNVPDSWQNLLGTTRGVICLSRRFNCPTRLGDDDQIYLVLPAIPFDKARLQLNEQEIALKTASTEETRLDITRLLETNNRFVMELTIPPDGVSANSGDFDGVTIEIQSQDD